MMRKAISTKQQSQQFNPDNEREDGLNILDDEGEDSLSEEEDGHNISDDVTQAQIVGKVVEAKFTLPDRKRVSPSPKPLATGSRREVARNDNAGVDTEKDEPRRITAVSPCRMPLSPPRQRSPIARRGSPPRRRVDSPLRRRPESPYLRGSPPPRRRHASPLVRVLHPEELL